VPTQVKVVQSLWIGDRLPVLQQLGVRSFLSHGYDYHLYTYGHLTGVPPGTTLKDGNEILSVDAIFRYAEGFGKGSYAAFSNVFRYQLLWGRGGWWVDTDVVCLRPLDDDSDYVFATERDTDGTIYCATSVMRAPIGAPILEYCLAVARAKDQQMLVWAEIGPLLLTDAVRRFDMAKFCASVHVFNPIDYFAFATIVAPGFDLSRVASSRTVHLWNQMWQSHDLATDGRCPSDSLLGWLLHRYGPRSGDERGRS
jgi:mannosyltransferase OCH1-like enzyme